MTDKRDEKFFSVKAAKALAMSLTAFAGRRYVLSRVIGTISPSLRHPYVGPYQCGGRERRHDPTV